MVILRLIRAFLILIAFAAFLWGTGLVLFVGEVRSLDAATLDPADAPADAIVVLTGGSERLRVGLELLAEGKGKKLFVSGVHPGLALEHVLANQSVAQTLRDCCIVLGHAAESTQGNAEETQSWLALENYHSFRLVTANYHMPRSLLLFRTLMPDTAIIPHPIMPESVVLDAWWMHEGTASLLITEYDKYLFARFGLAIGAL